jgi:hypothetical protein
MSKNFARIVLLGRSSNKVNSNFNKNLLGDIKPTEIPKEFIEKIDVTFSTGRIVEFEIDRIKVNFTLEAVEDFLSEYNTKGQIKLIEITLDLDEVHKTIQSGTDGIFSKYF